MDLCNLVPALCVFALLLRCLHDTVYLCYVDPGLAVGRGPTWTHIFCLHVGTWSQWGLRQLDQ